MNRIHGGIWACLIVVFIIFLAIALTSCGSTKKNRSSTNVDSTSAHKSDSGSLRKEAAKEVSDEEWSKETFRYPVAMWGPRNTLAASHNIDSFFIHDTAFIGIPTDGYMEYTREHGTKLNSKESNKSDSNFNSKSDTTHLLTTVRIHTVEKKNKWPWWLYALAFALGVITPYLSKRYMPFSFKLSKR